MANTRGVYRRDKIWWVRYSGPTGKTIWESSHSERKQDAIALYHLRKAGFRVPQHPATARMGKTLFKDLAADYLEWATRQRSYISKSYTVRQLVDAFGAWPLNAFTSKMLEKHQTALLANGRKPATVNRTLAAIQHMFTKAVEWNMVDVEVRNRLRAVRPLKENNKRLRYLSAEDCQRLLDNCPPHLRPIVTMALHSGMRKSEILGLRWDCVDLKNRLILLRQEDTKNSERREIWIDDTLMATLTTLPRRSDVPYVFYHPNSGKRYLDCRGAFHTALRKTGIVDFRIHDLRHTFASHMAMAGVGLITLKDLLGHKTLAMTARYSHLSSSHRTEAYKALDKVLSAPKPD